MKNLINKILSVALTKNSEEFSRLLYREEIKRQKENAFIERFNSFKKNASSHKQRFSLEEKDISPYYDDNTSETPFDTHYIYHPAWAARIVKELNPEFHTDISSTLHFCSVLSAFLQVKFYDYRPARLNLSGLETGSADLTKLHFKDNSISSLSCMHTIEHIGLGRYGDPIDYDGDLKASAELSRVLAPNGSLLIVTPVGRSRIMFNAHRIYAYRQIIEMFSDLQLAEFSLIPDNAIETGMIYNASEELSDKQNYGCGCFWFRKVKE